MQNAEKMPDDLTADLKDTLAYAEELKRNGEALREQAEKASEASHNTLLMSVGVFEEAKRRAIRKLGLLPSDTLDLTTFTFVRNPPSESKPQDASNPQPGA